MGLLRSEAMKYGMLVMPVQEARNYVSVIGKEVNMQFEDMNASEMRRPYRQFTQRLDEMERIVRYLFEKLATLDCTIVKYRFSEWFDNDSAKPCYKLDDVETELKKTYKTFLSFQENNDVLTAELSKAQEELVVVKAAVGLFGPQHRSISRVTDEESSGTAPLLEADTKLISCIAGVVPMSEQQRFARAVFRASRGNSYARFELAGKLVDPKTGKLEDKAVFTIFAQGSHGERSSMYHKLIKVCIAFNANTYAWPEAPHEAYSRLKQLEGTVLDKQSALDAFTKLMKDEASSLVQVANGANSLLEDWRLFCIKEKTIYHVLNMCEGDLLLRVNCWYPEKDEPHIKQVLAEASVGKDAAALTPIADVRKTPPTYFRTNDFTENWNLIIWEYGCPRYQEVNAGLFAMVTFPFCFGMMYGDVGHGSMMFLLGCYLAWQGDSLKYTMPGLYKARYMVMQLGFYAIFAGFMYNDFFSAGLALFKSGWEDPDGDGNYEPNYDITNSGGPGPYPFGLDWAWHGAANELLFLNSLKMKLSVLFGVIQMTFGLCLRVSNAIYFRSAIDLVCECIPMFIFMICFFGWMDFMILYKWYNPVPNPPNIIQSLISMAMAPAGVGSPDLNPLWTGDMSSVKLSSYFMYLTLISIPWLLVPKPLILLMQSKKVKKQSTAAQTHGSEEPAEVRVHVVNVAEEEEHAGGGHGHDLEHFEFGECFIHQVIETIEYVLGTISHTASYLRIWALSLAHEQLSLVFFQKTISTFMEMGGSPMLQGFLLYLGFVAWFGITVGVLLGMDSLECFLHCLRLHWVEFQSKFYHADGYFFTPYNVRKILEETD